MIHAGETFYQIAPAARGRALSGASALHVVAIPGNGNCEFSSPTTTVIRRAGCARSPSIWPPSREVIVVAPDRNRSGASNSLTLETPLRVEQRRRQPLLRQRHADRLRAHRDHGAARARARRADLGHQSWRQSRRRRAVLGHRRGRDGGPVPGHSVDRGVARARTGGEHFATAAQLDAQARASATSPIRCRPTRS